MVKDGWLTPKGVKLFFFIILSATIMGALSSCTHNPVYYLQVNDYNEESVCVNIVDCNQRIIMVLDTNIDLRKNPQYIVESINNGQVGYSSVESAMDSYSKLILHK